MAGYSVVLTEIAKPAHIMWVPVKLFFLNFAAHMGLIFLCLGVPNGDNYMPFALLSVLVTHCFIAWRYVRDPHIEKVWRARFITGRRMPWQRTTNMTPYKGNKYTP